VRLEVRNLKHITEAVLEGDRILLYGPNGGGKSTLIHTVALILGAALGVKAHDENVVKTEDFRNETYVKFEDFDTFEIKERKLWWREKAFPLTEPLKTAEFSLWHITESYFAIYGRVPQCLDDIIRGNSICGIGYSFDGEIEVVCPAAAEAVRLPLFEVYYNAADVGKDEEKWIPLSRLSYGQKRALVLLAALKLGDYVFVENLEAGLHIDYLEQVISGIAVSKGRVVAETHSGVALKLAKRRGIRAYYVENEAKPIENLDIELYKREAKIIASLL